MHQCLRLQSVCDTVDLGACVVESQTPESIGRSVASTALAEGTHHTVAASVEPLILMQRPRPGLHQWVEGCFEAVECTPDHGWLLAGIALVSSSPEQGRAILCRRERCIST